MNHPKATRFLGHGLEEALSSLGDIPGRTGKESEGDDSDCDRHHDPT